jgi:hypothetical protein
MRPLTGPPTRFDLLVRLCHSRGLVSEFFFTGAVRSATRARFREVFTAPKSPEGTHSA